MLRHLTTNKLLSQKSTLKYLNWKILSAIFFLFFSSATVFAQTRYVATTGSDAANDCTIAGSPCRTINYAVGQAVAGNTIEIAAGTYNESVTVSKALTIQGVGNTTIIDGTNTLNDALFIPTGQIGVTIQNLRIQNFRNAGIKGNQNNNNLSITNVEIDNCGITPNGQGGIYINGNNGGVNNVSITNSIVTNCYSRGIVIWNGFKTNITITGNTVSNNNCCGIELQDGTASGVNISNNTLINNTDNGIGLTGLKSGSGTGTPNIIENNTLTNNGRFGIEVKLPDGTGVNAATDGAIIVRNNTVERTVPIGAEVRDLAGIAVFRRGFILANGNVDIPNGVYVTNNTVRGYQQPSTSDGFGIVVEGTNMTVINNTLESNDVGVQSQQGHTPYTANTSTDGNQNNLADQYFGRGNSPTTSCINLGTNTFVTNTVNTRSVGIAGGAVTNTNTGETFCSIQSAINAVTTLNGHTLSVSAGTYTENNIAVNKELTIIGTGNGTNPAVDVILDPTSAGATGFIISASNVTLQNMRITGAGYGVRIDNVTVSNILLDQLAVTNHGNIGIFVQAQNSNGTGIQNVTISNSTFSQNGTGGGGNGDISFFRFNGNASLSNITVTDGTGHIGLQIRGWDNGNASFPIRAASFLPAGTVSLNNVSIEGSYKRLAFPMTVAGAPMYISGYSANLNAISFTDVSLTSVASDNTYLRTCLYVSETIAPQTLNLGNTRFDVKATVPITNPFTNNSYIINQTQVVSINATASPFYIGGGLLLDKTNFTQAFTIEDYIIHGTDANYITDANPVSPLGGFVEFNTGHAYTTLNSYIPGLTTEPNIGRAVECSQDGFTIVIQKNGVNAASVAYNEYALPFTVNKTLTFKTDAANYTETTLQDITMNGAAKTLTFDGNFGISEKLSMQNGDVIVAGGTNFALRSTAARTALIVNASPTNTVQGNVIAERYIPQSSTIPSFGGGGYDGQAYHLFSSPFSDATISQFGDDMGLVLNTAYNTAPEPAFVRPFPNFFQFEETNNDVVTSAYYNPFISNYKVPTTPNLLAAKGYQANIATQQIVDLNGTLNNGTQSIGVTNSGGQGYNLIGNPYPSPISWTALYNLNNTLLNSEVQFDIPVSQYNGNFASYTASGVSNNGGTDEIASMQGFFVRANTAGTVNIDNSVRLTTDARFYKTTEIENTKQGLIRLAIEKGGMADETTIYFQEGATPNYDNGFDAGKLHKMNSKFSTLYSYNENAEQTEYFSINGLGNFDKEQKLPLAINIVVEGEYEITLRTLKYFHSTHEIYLYDSLTNTLHNLRTDGNYKFNAKAGTEIKRFVILFKADANPNFFTNEKVVVYPNPTTNEFSYSLKTEREGNCTVRLFDATGKLILEENKIKEGAFLEGIINLENQPKGLYLLQVSDSKKTITARIVKE